MSAPRRDAFSRFHPAVNFAYFLGAIGFGVVIQHPAYLLVAFLAAAGYYLFLHGKKGLRTILGLLPIFAVLSLINPLFNTGGDRVLLRIFGRPYTLQALYYGMAIGGMFVVMMLWFGCYNAVLTSDKFMALFGSLAPGISLLLVMILRLIPNLLGKIRQISGARDAIGKGVSAGDSRKEKLLGGAAVLSSLTDWALEGSVVTADSMSARGYGTGRRTGFQIYRMTPRDWGTLLLLAALALAVIAAGGTRVSFTPVLSVPPAGLGLAAYGAFLLLPVALDIKEAVQWNISIWKI